MNFFGLKRKEESPRDKQIKEFKENFPNFERPFKSDDVLDIPTDVAEQKCTVRIYLKGDFPSESPAIQVLGPIKHSWISQNGTLSGCLSLTNWSKSSSLALVMKDIIKTLQDQAILVGPSIPIPPTASNNYNSFVSPPAFSSSQQPTFITPSASSAMNPSVSYGNLPSYPSLSASVGTNSAPLSFLNSSSQLDHNYRPNLVVTESVVSQISSSSSSSSSSCVSSSTIAANTLPISGKESICTHVTKSDLPDMPHAFPEIESLTHAQIRELLGNPEFLDAFCENIRCVSQSFAILRDYRAFNEKTALTVDENGAALRSKKDEIVALQAKLKSRLVDYDTLWSELNNKYSTSRVNVKSQLTSRLNELDKGSEDILGRNGEGKDVLNNLQDYIDKRTKYHALKTKISTI